MRRTILRAGPALLLGAVAGCLLFACGSCGYRAARGPVAGDVKTVFVPIFDNYSFRRGYEFQLTKAVIDQIQTEGALRVVSRDKADSELLVTIMEYREPTLLEDQKDAVLEAEVMASFRVVWRDLHTGRIIFEKDGLQVRAPYIVPRGEDEETARREAFKRFAERLVDAIRLTPAPKEESKS